jgi:hypothetical protein
MIYHEYDADGWLIGWHEDANRPNSTTLDYAPIAPSRARFVAGAWVEDASRENAQAVVAAYAECDAHITERINAQARAWGYAGIGSIGLYADEPAVPKYQAECRALRAWQALTWAAAEEASKTAATIEDVLAALPPPPARPTC